MLIEFSVGNYRSFKDENTFSMLAANLEETDEFLDKNNLFAIDKNHKLLKSNVIYGPNASGKSNFVQAIFFMRYFVLNSLLNSLSSSQIDVEPFRLSTETENEPSYFEIVLAIEDTRYRYGFEVSQEKVHSEWLYYVPNTDYSEASEDDDDELNLFEREDNEFSLSEDFQEGKFYTKHVRDNTLFLSVLASLNEDISKKIVDWLQKLEIISGVSDYANLINTMFQIKDDVLKKDIFSFVKSLDVGIDSIQINQQKAKLSPQIISLLKERGYRATDEIKIKTGHQKYNDQNEPVSLEFFDLYEHESAGTQKIFALSGYLVDILRHGKVLIIDELDARLHPLITIEIIRLFHSKQNNPHHAQLVFTTHDTYLLSNKLFRRDQIWFTEKDRYGVTSLYSLAEYRVRHDISFEKGYLSGRYGAIPFITGFYDLIKDE